MKLQLCWVIGIHLPSSFHISLFAVDVKIILYELCCKKEVKLSLCLINYASRHEDVLGSGGIAPTFLTLAIDGGEWSATHPCHFTPRERGPVPKLGGPQGRP
jgi:hypothetical protein